MNVHRMWYSFALLLIAPAIATVAADKDSYGDPLPDGAKARIGTARMRASTYYASILAPDGKSLYMQTNAGVVRVDPTTGVVQGKEKFSNVPTALSRDGKRGLYSSYNSIIVFEIDSGKTITKVERSLPSSSDVAAALSADGKTLAVGGTANREKKEPVTILVWDVDNKKELKKIAVPQNEYVNVAISDDGKAVASWGSFYDPQAKQQPDPETNPSRFVTFWDAVEGKELSKFRVSAYMPAGVVFSPDGSLAAVANGNSSIDLVDVKTGVSKQLLLGRSRLSRSMAFSPDGGIVAVASEDGTIQRWKTADGSRLSTTESPNRKTYSPHVRLLNNEKGIAWSANGYAINVWEIPSGKLLSPAGGHTSPIRTLAVTPDNKYVISSAEDGITLKWELATGKPAGEVKFRSTSPYMVGNTATALFSPTLKHALIRDNNGLCVYDVSNLTEEYNIPSHFEGYSAGTFTTDGSKIVITSNSYNTKKVPARVTVWDTVASKRLSSLELLGVGMVSAAVTPDGKHIVTVARVQPENGKGECLIAAWDLASGMKKGESSEEAGFSTIHAAAADNTAAVVATSKGTVAPFDIATGKLGKPLKIGTRTIAIAPVFSADGKRLAIACQNDFGTNAAEVRVFDWPTGNLKDTFVCTNGTPTCMTFSPDGQSLVTGALDTTATVWELGK